MDKLQQLILESTIIDDRCKQCPNLVIPWVAYNNLGFGPQRITFATCILSKPMFPFNDKYRGMYGECDPDNCGVTRS